MDDTDTPEQPASETDDENRSLSEQIRDLEEQYGMSDSERVREVGRAVAHLMD